MLPRHAFIYSIAKIARDGKFEINKTLVLWAVPYLPPPQKKKATQCESGMWSPSEASNSSEQAASATCEYKANVR